MHERCLQEILTEYYGIENHSLEFLREGGTFTYIVNGTVIIVTHDEKIANRAKRIIRLEDGRIVG